jgi:hypothetical protein
MGLLGSFGKGIWVFLFAMGKHFYTTSGLGKSSGVYPSRPILSPRLRTTLAIPSALRLPDSRGAEDISLSRFVRRASLV